MGRVVRGGTWDHVLTRELTWNSRADTWEKTTWVENIAFFNFI